MNETEGWVHLLQKKIRAHKLAFNVHNESISGDTTAGGLDRINFVLARHKPKILLLGLGANDGLQGRSTHTLRTNLVKIINRSRNAGAKILLLSMRIPKSQKYGLRYANSFYNTFIELGRELNIPLVPFILEDIAIHENLMLKDRLHPNAQAQMHILEDIWPYLLPMLQSKEPDNPKKIKQLKRHQFNY